MVSRSDDDLSPARRLERLARLAIDVGRKAKKHKQNLSGTGFYARKFNDLRIGATNAFTELESGTAGDASALAELVATVFDPHANSKARAAAERELTFALRTTWREDTHAQPPKGGFEFFPSVLLGQTRRGYLAIIGRQINGTFEAEFFDACAVMMRRLFEISIIEAFEGKGLANKIKDANGDYLQLSDLVAAALSEPKLPLSRNTKRVLPKLRDNAHLSAHGRSYFAQRADLERIQTDYRVSVEEMLRLSGLLG